MIDTEENLQKFLPTLRAAKWIAVDTEADSLHAYPEKLCLIQISTAAGDDLIDPLSGINLNPVLDTLNNHELIMHGSDYDLRLLEKHHQFVPRSIFDTMLAARLLGLRQFGLNHLVKTYLDVELEKGAQKADWSRRPLTPRMITYARNDTHYLKPLADKLRGELESKNRLAWHRESCTQLIAECSIPRVPDMNTIWRIKGSAKLGRPALAMLRELWSWREKEAVAANRPPFFILSHETMVDIADAAAHSRDFHALLPPRMSNRRRDALFEAIARGLAVRAEEHPEFLRQTGRRLTPAQLHRLYEFQNRRDKAAHELGIDPTLIASKSILVDLARDWDKHQAELMDWQRALLKN